MIRARALGLLTASAAALAAGCGGPAAAEPAPPAETLTPLFSQVLPNAPGQSLTSAVVTFPPGARAKPHRHGDAFVYAYVLDGSITSQLDGLPAHTYRRGENWSEPPGAHHVLTENTSATQEASLLVVFVAPSGAALKTDDPGN